MWGSFLVDSLLTPAFWGSPGQGFSTGLPARETQVGGELPADVQARLERVFAASARGVREVSEHVELWEGLAGL